jgi:hypothetical protein
MRWLISSAKPKLFPIFTSVRITLLYFTTELYLTYFGLVAGGKVNQVAGDATAAHPSWRKALVHLILNSGWVTSTPFSVRQLVRQLVTQETQKLADLVPGFGSYVNEYVEFFFFFFCRMPEF